MGNILEKVICCKYDVRCCVSVMARLVYRLKKRRILIRKIVTKISICIPVSVPTKLTVEPCLEKHCEWTFLPQT